jgi:F0F1-type ATP synthase membrane subunit c/vacuolar-type H+-ATPase subunit K
VRVDTERKVHTTNELPQPTQPRVLIIILSPSVPRQFTISMASSRERALFCLCLLGLATVAEAADSEVAPFFGFMGAACALVFSCMGAAYGTAKSGVGVASMGVMRPELVMKSIVPVVMAGVLGIYGLVIAVIISTGIPDTGCAVPPHLTHPRTTSYDHARVVPQPVHRL